MSASKPIKLYGKAGPNPPKVALILNELGLETEIVNIPFSDVKNPEYTVINPNGRLPSIHDPNTNLTLWESGAIIEYLIETYDKEHKLSFAPGTPEYFHAKQWLYFQVTGQGPYFGQAVWFTKFHAEQLPSAKERYNNEVKRVYGVLEDHLNKEKSHNHKSGVESDGPWLVGNKLSYADLSFTLWNAVYGKMVAEDAGFNENDYPTVKGWMDKMTARPSVVKAFELAFSGQ